MAELRSAKLAGQAHHGKKITEVGLRQRQRQIKDVR